ncbi:hypothetical protein [Salininema proteolyticum]|uniref:Halobacterial output domain-containing protein n=1 Tax=Salininema proteolyticum TaxID=1607685 RepID=A0ABV8TVL9_9ACTN
MRERISAELAASAVPIGIIAHCHLGEDFQVHTITPALDDIIAHYRRGEPLPDGLERARAWTRTASYLAVEVYEDGVLCIRPDGTVIKAEG